MMSKKAVFTNIFVTLLLVTILITACGTSQTTPPVIPESAQAGDLVNLEPCTYNSVKEEYPADCGMLIVPENRSNPETRLISLPIIRVRSKSNHPVEPVFFLSGGPGTTNMSSSRVSWFVENRDFVLVGYRGVDGSVSLNCPEVGQVISNLPGDLLGEEALDRWANANSQCAQRLQKEGVDTDGYTVVEVVDDFEAARTALGYERINLYSVSYGTRLAMIYAWRYPDSIHRSAMIAVNPPGGMVYESDVINTQLAYYADLCTKTPKCSSRTDDLAEAIRKVNNSMPDRWLGLPINAGMIRAASFESLNDTRQAPMVFDVWLAAAKGDYSGMALLTLAGPFMFVNATNWGDNTAKNTSTGDYETGINYGSRFNPPDSIIGSPRSELAASMTGWPAAIIPEEYRQVQHSDVETLLVSGSIDFWTPQQLAEEELLPALSKGQHVVVAEAGHGEMMSSQPEATGYLLNTFYDTGVGDASLFTYQPWEFKVGFGFPLIAKIIVLIVVLVLVALAFLIRFIGRRIRRRKSSQVAS